MNNEAVNSGETTTNQPFASDTTPKYDPHIVPAETAARMEREGGGFMKTPSTEDDLNREEQVESAPIETTGGYTVDNEGLLNNFAVEPEMYVNEPGDLKPSEEELEAERAEEVLNLNEDEQGKLTMEGDKRGKGPGIV